MEYQKEQFWQDCEKLHIVLKDEQKMQFERYYELLTEWNSFMNLTAITDYSEVLKKHFLDSLTLTKGLALKQAQKIIDVGTGAGFPGIPLKIAFPHLEVVLLDSLGKRVRFLEQVVAKLQLEHVICIHGRAEDVARDQNYREQFDLCVSRAVANLSSLSEYCLPFVRRGGKFASYKSGKIEEELQSARYAVNVLGGELQDVCKFALPDVGERSIIIIEKVKSTPKKYPRKAGVPSREPISN